MNLLDEINKLEGHVHASILTFMRAVYARLDALEVQAGIKSEPVPAPVVTPPPAPDVAPVLQPVLFNGDPNNMSSASSVSTGTDGAIAASAASGAGEPAVTITP